ncbi:16115_t:CDS:2, partial [Racocetra fulgida]
SSTSQNLITLNTLNPYSDLNDDCENETDSFDNVNEMDFFDDENEMNFDVIRINQLEKNNINIAESSSVENITLSQEFIELATNRSSYYKSNKLPLMQPNNLPMDNFDQNEFDSNSDQSEHDSNSNQSEDNDSEQSEHDVNQDIDEKFDIDEETDEDCDRIMPSSSLLTDESNERLMNSPYERQVKDSVLGDIYDGKIWKEFLDEEGHPFFVGDNADVRIGLALNVDWYTPY